MRRRIEEHSNHERWLVSYADFITLLFAFFAMLYAILLIDGGRNQASLHTVFDLFSNPKTTLAPELTNLKTGNSDEDFNALQNQLRVEFAKQIDAGNINLNQTKQFLAIDLDAKILFDSGRAIPHPEAVSLIAQIAKVLHDDPHAIQVAGFTDDAPIANALYPSNWELSSARAAKIVRMLIEQDIAPQRLSAVGYGEFHPHADNHTDTGRMHNRRVVIRLLKTT